MSVDELRDYIEDTRVTLLATPDVGRRALMRDMLTRLRGELTASGDAIDEAFALADDYHGIAYHLANEDCDKARYSVQVYRFPASVEPSAEDQRLDRLRVKYQLWFVDAYCR